MPYLEQSGNFVDSAHRLSFLQSPSHICHVSVAGYASLAERTHHFSHNVRSVIPKELHQQKPAVRFHSWAGTLFRPSQAPGPCTEING